MMSNTTKDQIPLGYHCNHSTAESSQQLSHAHAGFMSPLLLISKNTGGLKQHITANSDESPRLVSTGRFQGSLVLFKIECDDRMVDSSSGTSLTARSGRMNLSEKAHCGLEWDALYISILIIR